MPSPDGYSGATLHLDIDQGEHERRTAAGLGVAIGQGFGGLGTLMTLPQGLPVPLAGLTTVQHAPAGICTVTGGHVVRHVTRPCRITLATVQATSATKTAMESASRFAPFCARQVVISRPPTLRQSERLQEFGFYGIGVVLEHEDGRLETLVETEPWRPRRHTPAAWWFAERAYHQYLNQLSALPETAVPSSPGR